MIIPVALNSGVYWGRRSLLKRPGTIVIEILPAMPAGLDRRAFMAELERRIETATRRLEAEAYAALARTDAAAVPHKAVDNSASSERETR